MHAGDALQALNRYVRPATHEDAVGFGLLISHVQLQ